MAETVETNIERTIAALNDDWQAGAESWPFRAPFALATAVAVTASFAVADASPGQVDTSGLRFGNHSVIRLLLKFNDEEGGY